MAAPVATKGKPENMLPYSRCAVVSDGLSDRGRLGPLTNFRYPPSPPFAEGRRTGGPSWAGHLTPLPAVPLSADDNRAMGGAITDWRNINEPLRDHRFGAPADIAQAILLAAANPFITGATVDVDGGARHAR
jgi:hypothetical protein